MEKQQFDLKHEGLHTMYNYTVVIKGLEKVPLKTTRPGAMCLISAFKKDECDSLILDKVDQGVAFKNDTIQVMLDIEQEKSVKKPVNGKAKSAKKPVNGKVTSPGTPMKKSVKKSGKS